MPEQLDHVPDPVDWRRLGLENVRALAGGHQSRVFSARLKRRRVVAKLTNSAFVDQGQFAARMNMLGQLALIDSSVVAPTPLEERIVNRHEGWLLVVFPMAPGRSPDTATPSDVALMGQTLAGLHRSLATIPTIAVGRVAALEVIDPPLFDLAPQLLHGDFSASNLRHHDRRMSVFDFDDCGYGPVEFDVANALYMELFDAIQHDRTDRYDAFRSWFVDAYTSVSGISIDDDLLDALIGVRRNALGYWIRHLDQAPIGIRNSPPEWLEYLEHFVAQI